MGVVQDIAGRTSAGSKMGAASIGELASLAGDMRQSIEGFKLPKEELAGELLEQEAALETATPSSLSEYMPDFATVTALGDSTKEGSLVIKGGNDSSEKDSDAGDKPALDDGKTKEVEPTA